MSVERLILDHFAVWTSAVTYNRDEPELRGIQKLRDLILEFGIRGRLVEQDPRDPPVSDVLDSIQPDKPSPHRAGKLTDESESDEDDSAGRLFRFPTNWARFRLGSLITLHYGKALPKKNRVEEGHVDVFGSNGVVGRHNQELISDPCIVIGRKGSAGAVNIVKGPCWVTDVAYYVIPPRGLNLRFTDLLLRWLRLDQLERGIKPGINRNEVYGLQVPVPPTNEQERIVGKVDELMALCDRLEQQTHDQLEAHETLVDSLLETLTDSEDATELAENWTRLAEHFDTLFTTTHSVDQLQRTISQAAIMGQLVRPNPKEEPAYNLLARIEDKQADLIAEGIIQTNETPKKNPQTSHLAYIPNHWELARIADIATVRGGIQKQSARTPKHQAYPYLRVADVRRGTVAISGPLPQFELFNNELSQYRLKEGDILVVEGNGSADEIGRCAMWNGEVSNCVYQNHLIRVRLLEEGMEQFLMLYLNSPAGIREMKRLAVTTSGLYNLSVGKIRNIEVPIPPLAEQERIVEKVGEIQSLCSQLREHLGDCVSEKSRLADILVERAKA